MFKKFSIFNFQFSKIDIFLVFILTFLYFLTRVYHLTRLPVFCDEAIYIRWAQIMRNEPSLRFLPLQDGKQPLFMWLVMPALKLFSDPLFAGRFISVLAGFVTFLGIVIYRHIIIGGFGWLEGLIYLLLPFSLFFDRMALVDSLLSAFGIWALNFAVLLGRNLRLDLAMILGMILGGALLTKSPGIFFLILTPIIIFLELIIKNRNLENKLKINNYFKALFLLLISLIFAFGIYNILRLGPNFHLIKIRNRDYVYSLAEVKQHPSQPLLGNIRSIWRYYWHYLTIPLLFLGLGGILFLVRNWGFEAWGLFLWWGLPLLTQALVAKVFTARYILFSIPVFVLFVGWGLRTILRRIKNLSLNPLINKILKTVIILIILIPSFYFDWQLWHNPVRANFPQDEKKGYLEDWTAGWGIKPVADYLKNLPKDRNIIVGTEGFFGTLPDGLQIYLEGEDKITIIGVGYPIKTISQSLIDAQKAGDRVYLLVNQSRLEIAKRQGLKLIKSYPKPGGDELLFFEISNF